MSLRGLLALKARLWWRAIPAKRRVAVLVLIGLALAGTTPVWIGGSALAYAGVRSLGAPALVVAFAVAQATWIVLTVLSSAWGEAFDLRRMLRFPVHPRTVYLAGIVFSMVGLPALIVLPALTAAVLAALARGGPVAAAAAALGVALLLALTGALLQLLLTLLQEAQRHRWLRLVHEGLATVLAGAGYLIYLEVRRQVGRALEQARPDAPAIVTHAADVLRRLAPPAAWPAAPAEGALEGRWTHAALGTLGALALLVGLVELGWRLAHRVALDRETAAPAAPARAAAGGGLAAPRLLRGALGALMEREVTLVFRGPQVLGSAVFGVVIVLLFRAMDREMLRISGPWLVMMMSLQLQQVTRSLFGMEREGLRLLFLLPLPGRALVIAKDLGAALPFVLTVALALVTLAITGFPVIGPAGLDLVAWALAVLAVSVTIGNHVSSRFPMRLDRRGRSASPGGVAVSVLHGLAMVGMIGLLALASWLMRRAAGELAAALAALAVAALLVALWWALLGRAGRTLDASREEMLAVIAVPSESG